MANSHNVRTIVHYNTKSLDHKTLQTTKFRKTKTQLPIL